jgi:hypothetical protein
MVIDRPGFYFSANKVKRWLLIIAFFSFIFALITAGLNIIEAVAVFMGITIFAILIYVILWFIT